MLAKLKLSLLVPAEEQAVRFVRLFVYTLAPQLLLLDFKHLDRSALIALIVPALETAWKELRAQYVARTTTPELAAPANPPAVADPAP